MAYLNGSALDNGLQWLTTNGTRLDITSIEATTFAQATSSCTTGCAVCAVGAPGAGAPNGRQVTVGAISNGSVLVTGCAGFWAITGCTNALLVTGSLSASQAVTLGNTFTLTAFTIRYPSPT